MARYVGRDITCIGRHAQCREVLEVTLRIESNFTIAFSVVLIARL
jgi:hypothetical protein